MRLVLVRHGQTPANVAGVIESSFPGPGLTGLGVEQAAAVPAALAAESVDSISVSRLVRTHLTAAPLARATGIEPVERPGLHEVQAGVYEGGTGRDAIQGYVGVVARWGAGELDARMPGAEDGHEFFARFDADVRAIADSGSRVAVVVSHGAAIRVWSVVRSGNVDASFLYERDLGNTGVVVLEGSPDEGWTLLTWQGDPVGGHALEDETALDPTGEAASA
ncbi:histidine phosphatase family protein [Galbitalea sp. SE-J8]|uniref:histidine phosphatase family protein n=1 Tax=Galbitalea sp. SE-J8 TaxID=3054952 RepID=UPI00259CB7BD|nr:histidine phosphatase family protein [Galbitalea sp. SE-J8]MDM4763170.1 histidine phosphatase family protein [Galbitalea sp. SE-J8]